MANQFFRRLFPKTLIYSRSLRPLSGAVILPSSFRSLSTRATIPSVIGSASPPNATALKLRNGCDYHRRLVFMQSPYPGFFRGVPTEDEITDFYVKTLAAIVGSEDEGRMMVYSSAILHKDAYSFGTLLSDELSDRVKEHHRVFIVIPDDPFAKDNNNIDEISDPVDQLDKYVRNAIARGEKI